jgi:hypothetical protein
MQTVKVRKLARCEKKEPRREARQMCPQAMRDKFGKSTWNGYTSQFGLSSADAPSEKRCPCDRDLALAPNSDLNDYSFAHFLGH